MASREFSIGIDIGGTFTDVVLITADGSVHCAKGLSTPDAFERGIFAILHRLIGQHALAPERCRAIVHGTTVATNAIIERKGARTGLITTRGFRDVLELRRIRIPKLYDLTWQKPEPLVERHLRQEVDERITYRGEVQTALDPSSVRTAIAALKRWNVEALAVTLLNAYANSSHERAVRDIVRQEWPEVEVSLSSDVLPEMREYERTSTTVINAYIMPVVRRYVASLEQGLREMGFGAPLLLMQSNGGAMAAELACEMPMHIIESGPAAGVVAAHRLASDLGASNALTLDIGGTTAKASLIEESRVAYSKEYEVGAEFTRSGQAARGGGYPVRAPTLDIAEIGAGGGSIVWVDGGGALHVGPHSAGAVPGPVCYGLGGTEPTLADACLVLGYLDPAGLAGGEVPLDETAARRALESKIARPLGLDVIQLAHGVVQIAATNMTRAIRSVSTERGKDPRDFDLIAFGGNGGLFAAAVARELEIPRIIVPPAAGIFSAFGLLYADLEHHFTHTLLGRVDAIDLGEAEAKWQRLEAEALAALGREGFAPSQCRIERFGQLRYVSQSYELQVPWPDGEDGKAVLERLAADFEDLHERTYGHRGQDNRIELVNLHLVARGVPDSPKVPGNLTFERVLEGAAGESQAYFGDGHGWLPTRLVGRGAVSAEPVRGPMIVRELDTTILVPPDFSIGRDRGARLIMVRA